MRIKHKFLNINPKQNPLNWDYRFYTENLILKNIDIYKPEVMFLGTFNPELKNNPADFFMDVTFSGQHLKTSLLKAK